MQHTKRLFPKQIEASTATKNRDYRRISVKALPKIELFKNTNPLVLWLTICLNTLNPSKILF